jgi:hypothetical protein
MRKGSRCREHKKRADLLGASTTTLVLGLWHEARLISNPPQLPGHCPHFGPCLIGLRFLENVSGMFALVMLVYATNKLLKLDIHDIINIQLINQLWCFLCRILWLKH